MDLSPNDIRSYEFPNQMRGYDKDEVDNFLEQVAAAMETVKQENLKLSMEVDSLKSQLAGLRQFEETIKNAAIDARRNYDSTVAKAKEEAAEMLATAKKQAEDLVGSRERRVSDIENQLRQLELTRKSYINRFRSLVESHQDIVNEIEQEDFPEIPQSSAAPVDETTRPAPKPTTPRDQLEVTDSSELRGERKEALHQEPTKTGPAKPEEANAPTPSDDAGEDESALDPELAAALKSYQLEYGEKAKSKETTGDDDITSPPHRSAPDPTKWQETSRRAEDIPPGFVPDPEEAAKAAKAKADEDAESDDEEQEASGTDKVAIGSDSQEHPTEHNTIDIDSEQKKREAQQSASGDISKELDEVVAKFEEEMDKAEKN